MHALLGDDRGQERGRGHVEGRVPGGEAVAHLRRVALLDRDLRAPRGAKVDRRARRHDVEGHAVMGREHRQRVGADLVRRVAVGRDAIGPGEDDVDLAAGDQRPCRGVRDDAVRHAGPLELPGGQARALEQRARLADEHVRHQSTLEALADRAERRPDAARGERARVAVREGPRSGLEQSGCVGGHAAAALDFLLVERPGASGESGSALIAGAHRGERPGEIDSGRARGEERGCGFVEVVAPGRGERIAVGGGDPDGRRTAHGQRADRLGDLAGGAAPELHGRLWKPPLVEHDDRVGLEADDLLRLEDYVPSSQDARYRACSAVRLSISTPMLSSLRRAISRSISSGTT